MSYQGTVHPESGEMGTLKQKALAQVTRTDARRIEFMQPGDALENSLARYPELACQVCYRHPEEAVLVQRLDQIGYDIEISSRHG